LNQPVNITLGRCLYRLKNVSARIASGKQLLVTPRGRDCIEDEKMVVFVHVSLLCSRLGDRFESYLSEFGASIIEN